MARHRVVPPARLREIIAYNPNTGKFTWKERAQGRFLSGNAGSPDPAGYIQIQVEGVRFNATVLAYALMMGKYPRQHLRHKDGNPSNNKWNNLILSSGKKAQHFRKKKWKRNRDLTAEQLKEILHYDPITGEFTWTKLGRKGRLRGRVGWIGNHGYAQVCINYKHYLLHVLAWLYMTGEWPPDSQTVDHENTHRLDNRWSNLRLATSRQQNWNKRLQSNNTLGIIGVYKKKGGSYWIAQIDNRYLGCFSSKEEAAKAYNAEAAKTRGEFADPYVHKRELRDWLFVATKHYDGSLPHKGFEKISA